MYKHFPKEDMQMENYYIKIVNNISHWVNENKNHISLHT